MDKSIGTETRVTVGLVLGTLGLIAAGFVGSIWWAATISAKLDSITMQLTSQATLQSKLSADVEELKAWRKVVDTVGSPHAQALAKEISDMRRELDMHKATTTPPPK